MDPNASYDESLDPDYTLSNAAELDSESDDGEADLTLYPDEEPVLQADTTAKRVAIPFHNFHGLVHKHEVPRKLLHSGIGFVVLYLHLQGLRTKHCWEPVLVACVIIYLLDQIRFRWALFNKAYCLVVGFLMREKEVNEINGVIWYQLGCVLAFYFQKHDVGVMSILLLSWSDTAASTVGRALGKYSPKIARGKSLIGSVAAFATGVAACYIFYGYITPRYPQFAYDYEYIPSENALGLHTLALCCGFIAAISEGIDIGGLDDNFTIPLLSSIFLKIVIDMGKL